VLATKALRIETEVSETIFPIPWRKQQRSLKAHQMPKITKLRKSIDTSKNYMSGQLA
jgi:hypothetical protein